MVGDEVLTAAAMAWTMANLERASWAFATIMLAGLLALPLSSTQACAQGGSTGGTVGKTDKSASGGGDEPAKHNAKSRAATKASSKVKRESGPSLAFEGAWEVSTTGRCTLPWKLTFLIANGAITGAGATGQISRGGSASGSAVVLGVKFDFIGHFGVKEASGTFVGPDGCPGQWTATKS
jgi:hypothetical protein